jgi:hypothetical protein
VPAPDQDPSDVESGEVTPVTARRRAAYLYGLIVSGAVLAAAPDNVSIGLVAVALVGTVLVYWVAETYAHWAGARAIHRRRLSPGERRDMLLDGLPLVSACVVPVLVLLVEALLSVDPTTAVRIALWVNVVLLVAVGWRISPTEERPAVRVAFAVMSGLLGLAMIGLKTLLH